MPAKKLNDLVTPSGIVAATYQVKAHRGSQFSAGSEPVTVLFGSQQQQAAQVDFGSQRAAVPPGDQPYPF